MSNAGAAAALQRVEHVDGPRRLTATDRDLIEHATATFQVLQGKWKLHLIVIMARGIRRHSRLLECLPGVSKKVMTECLRSLERDGLVAREIYAEVPARVEYSLTPLGWAITEAIVALSQWAEDHSEDVTHARQEYRHRAAGASDSWVDVGRDGAGGSSRPSRHHLHLPPGTSDSAGSDRRPTRPDSSMVGRAGGSAEAGLTRCVRMPTLLRTGALPEAACES